MNISWSSLHPSVKRALHALTPQELQMSDGDPNSPFTKLMRKLLTERDSVEFARKRLKYSKAQCKPTPKPARKSDDDSEDDRQDNLGNDSQRSYYAQQSRSSKDTPNGSQMTNRGNETHKTRQNHLSKQAGLAKLNWKTHAARGQTLSNSIRRAGYGHLLWPKKYIIPQKRGKTNRRTHQSPSCLMREGMCNGSTRKCSRKVKHTSHPKSNKFEKSFGTKYTHQTGRNDKWNANV